MNLAHLDTVDNVYLQTAYEAIDSKLGEDIVVLDIRDISILADFFIIATGKNTNQNQAMADEVGARLHQAGLAQRHVEGYSGANWILLDYGNIIVHIFDRENRRFYNIERVWGDAPVIMGSVEER